MAETVNDITTHTYSFLKYIFIKEVKDDRNFELSSFLNKSFFIEVFLSLVERQVRDGVRSGSGNSSIKETTTTYRNLILKHKEKYCRYSGYVPPKLTHAKQNADYECTKINTAYINNIKAHFGDRLKQVVNIICGKQNKIRELEEKMKAARYTAEAIKGLIKNTVITPCANVKISVSKKQVPSDNFLGEKEKAFIRRILFSYPQDYTFMKDSIYYDVKVNPLNHYKAFIQLEEIIEELSYDKEKQTCKSFVVYPLRTSFIPAHVTMDTTIMNYHILGAKTYKEEKSSIWPKIMNMDYKALKKQKTDKSLCFHGMIQTDGVTVSVLKQNFETGRRQQSRNSKPADDDGFTYIESMTKEQLEQTKEKCVLVDPGRRDILYCMKESSTPKNRQCFRFTKNTRSKKSRRFRYLRNQLKPDSIKSAEYQLSKFRSNTLDPDKFIEYLEARRDVGTQLKVYYSNETYDETPDYYPEPLDFVVGRKGDIYYGRRLLFIKRVENARRGVADLHSYLRYLAMLMSSKHLVKRLTRQDTDNLSRIISDTTKCLDEDQLSPEEVNTKHREVKQQVHKIVSKLLLLPFRRMKFTSKIYYDNCDMTLAKDLKEKFGNDSILIIGDWSAPTQKFHEPTRNKGLLKFLRKSGFSIYLIDEYKTSTCCPFCFSSNLEKFKEVQNPRPYQREKHPLVKCHGLLRCKSESCLAIGKRRIMNRDTAAVLNFRLILNSLREEGSRPPRFCRSAPKRQRTDEGGSQRKSQRRKQ